MTNAVLHSGVALIHLASALLATHFVAGTRAHMLHVYQFNYTLVHGEPAILTTVAWSIRASPVAIIAINEAITCSSHILALWYPGPTRRWVEYAVTAGLVNIALLIGLGESNLMLVLVVFLNNVALQLIGLTSGSSYPGFVLLGTTVAVLVTHVVHQVGLVMQWWYVVTLLAVFYASFGVHHMCASGKGKERVYIYLSLTSKIAISWTFIALYHSSLRRLRSQDADPWMWVIVLVSVAAGSFWTGFFCLAGSKTR